MNRLGDDWDSGFVEETTSMDDISLGSIDRFEVGNNVNTAKWLQDFNRVLQACSWEEGFQVDDTERIAQYLFERGWVPQAVPDTFQLAVSSSLA
jgi:hypothetical protein